MYANVYLFTFGFAKSHPQFHGFKKSCAGSMRNSTTKPSLNNSVFAKSLNWFWRTIMLRYWLLGLVFFIIVGILLSQKPSVFFTQQNLLNISRSFSWIAIAAFGQSLVIIIGGIDLSVGAVMGLSGLISALCMQAGLSVPISIIAGLLTGAWIGFINGTIVGRTKLPPFIVTLASMSLARGVTHGLSGGWSITNLDAGFRALGQNDLTLGAIAFPIPFIIMLVLAMFVSFLTKHTVLGRYIYALANNEHALTTSGINVIRVKVWNYTFCGALAAVGGLLMAARLGVATPTAATGYELDIITAAVIGGTSLFGGRGNILGVLVGAAFMQILRNGLVLLGFPAYWQEAAMGALILLAILVDYWRHISVSKNPEAPNFDVSLLWNWLPTKNRKWVLPTISGAVLISLILIGQIRPYSPKDTPLARTADPDTITIAWIPKALDNPIFELGHQGATQKASELSAGGSVQVNILYIGSVTSDAAEQVRVIEDAIARKVDAIAISCNDPTACIDPINKAVAAGIPVMTWDSDSPQSDRFTYLGVDNFLAGQTAADLLVGAMGEEGKVAVLTGVPGALNLEERVRGFRDGMRAYPNIEIVTTVVSNDDINTGVKVVEETMQAHPDLNGWFFVGMWPLFANRGSMPLWESAAINGEIKTVAFDTLPIELDLLRTGYLSGLVGQKYWGWGYDTVQILYEHIIHDKDYPTFISSGMDIVTENNIDAMIWAWENQDFSQPLPPP